MKKKKNEHLGGVFECHSIVKRSIKIVAMPSRSDKKYYTRLSAFFSLSKPHDRRCAFVICISYDWRDVNWFDYTMLARGKHICAVFFWNAVLQNCCYFMIIKRKMKWRHGVIRWKCSNVPPNPHRSTCYHV